MSLPSHGGEQDAFDLLQKVVSDLDARGGPPPLSGLKNKLRKVQPDFSEKKYGYRGFFQFVKAAETQGVVNLEWDEDAEDYIVTATVRRKPASLCTGCRPLVPSSQSDLVFIGHTA